MAGKITIRRNLISAEDRHSGPFEFLSQMDFHIVEIIVISCLMFFTRAVFVVGELCMRL